MTSIKKPEMRICRLGLVFALATLCGEPTIAGGIGVLGDSYSDEYQFYPPHRSTARNWVEILAETRGLDFGPMSESSRDEPRNAGFAYNWARSNASSSDLIASGQHTGLAAQMARGEVSIAVVFIGGNDVIHALHASSPSSALEGLGRRASKNVTIAVEAILSASPEAKVLLVTVPDVRDLPEFRVPVRDGSLDRAVADAAAAELDVINTEIRKIARSNPRVALLDFARITRISSYLAPETLSIAGHRVDRISPGDSVDHLFLADVRHLGTVGQGVFAKMVVDTLNTKLGTKIPPLIDREIITFAERVNSSIAASEPIAQKTNAQGQ